MRCSRYIQIMHLKIFGEKMVIFCVCIFLRFVDASQYFFCISSETRVFLNVILFIISAFSLSRLLSLSLWMHLS